MSNELPPIVDEITLNELRELLEDGFAELLRTYLNDLDADSRILEQRCMGGDAEALRKIAHKLKSASASVGAKRLSAIAFELEQMGREDELGGAVPALMRFAACAKATREALRAAMD